MSESFSFGLLLIVASLDSGFFLSVGVSAGFCSITADLRVTRTTCSFGVSRGTFLDSISGESGSDLTVMTFGTGNPTVFWNLSGTFRTRDDRGEGGMLDSGTESGADGVPILLVFFCSGVERAFDGLGFGIIGRRDGIAGSFDRTTAK